MEDDIWVRAGKPKPKKKYRFYYSDHHKECFKFQFGIVPNNKAFLDSGETVLYTYCCPVNWEDGHLPDDAIYLGEGFRLAELDNLDDETILEEINKLLD